MTYAKTSLEYHTVQSITSILALDNPISNETLTECRTSDTLTYDMPFSITRTCIHNKAGMFIFAVKFLKFQNV